MPKINPQHVHEVSRLINTSPYFDLLSMQVVEIASGFSRLEIDLARKHLQPFGYVHGGVFASIIDAAAFWAAYCDVEDPQADLVSIDLSLNFLGPAQTGKLIAIGQQIKQGKTLAYAQAEVRDTNDKLLAHGTSTLLRIERKLVTDRPLPPKFLE